MAGHNVHYKKTNAINKLIVTLNIIEEKGITLDYHKLINEICAEFDVCRKTAQEYYDIAKIKKAHIDADIVKNTPITPP